MVIEILLFVLCGTVIYFGNKINRTLIGKMELFCRAEGYKLHEKLISDDWKDLDSDGEHPTEFLKPIARYDFTKNTGYLLTGYNFWFKNEKIHEKRRVIFVYNLLTGVIEEKIFFGVGFHQSEQDEIDEKNSTKYMSPFYTQPAGHFTFENY